jgi:hypothetical protein
MRLKLVILWALLFHWSLEEIPNELNAHPDALALCRWNMDWDVISDALGEGFKTCTWLVAGPHGHLGELWPIVDHAVRWLGDSIRMLTGTS